MTSTRPAALATKHAVLHRPHVLHLHVRLVEMVRPAGKVAAVEQRDRFSAAIDARLTTKTIATSNPNCNMASHATSLLNIRYAFCCKRHVSNVPVSRSECGIHASMQSTRCRPKSARFPAPCPPTYNWLSELHYVHSHGGEQGSTGYVKRKWRVVVDQLATLKADHNFNCQRQLRFGCLITVARTADLSRSGSKVRR